MATTQKKSSSGTRSTQKKTGGSRAAPRSGGGRAKSKQPPIRREVAAIVCLLRGMCVLVSNFSADGWLIARVPKTLKGLLGPGFFLTVPALLGVSWVQWTHRGRPVALRTACLLLVPYLCGGLWHILFCRQDLTEAATLFKTLWESGFALKSGGILSGGTAHGFIAILGKPASAMIFVVLLAVLLMTAFEVTPALLMQMWRERERREYYEEDYLEDEEESYPPPEKAKKPAPRKKAPPPARPPIDIPLDGEPPVWTAPESSTQAGFFRPREKDQLTPADLIAGQPPEEAEPPRTQKTASRKTPFPYTPEPAPEPDPIPEPVPDPLPDPIPEPVPEPILEPVPFPPEPVREDPAFIPGPVSNAIDLTEPAPEPVKVVREPDPPPSGRRKKGGIDLEEASALVAAEIANGLEVSSEYDYPPIELLDRNNSNNYIEAGAELRVNAQRLADTLRSFGVDATAGDVIRGPAITRYEFTLEQGVKLNKVTNLADDIALALGASGVRIAPIPDKISVVGIEVPNKTVSPVLIRDVIESRSFMEHRSAVAFAVGRDIGNKDIVGDISRLPHALIAGTTGSGKSVCTNSLIISLLYKSSPEDVRFIMVDPKMVELAPYNGIPHLLIPVVTDPKKAAGALQWAVFEMMKRYKTFSELGVKKLEEYNAVAASGRKGPDGEELAHMASVVVVIDELADLMLVAAKEVEESICRVAQMGRAAGMHLVIATQRPSADVITGLMKANIPSRIAFAVASSLESRIILDATGAEKLVGRGDMLYAPLGSGKPIRVQGCFITPEEIDRVVKHVKSTGEAQYSDEVMQKIEESVQEKDKKGGGSSASSGGDDGDGDELLPAAVEVILETGQASVSMLQRRLKLGYSRAARLVDQMEERGYVGPFEGSKPRQLLITRAKWQEIQMGSAGGASDGGEPAAEADAIIEDSLE